MNAPDGSVVVNRSPALERGRPRSRPSAPARSDGWECRLQELLGFRTEHGHVNVPRGRPEYRSLANWVTNQRRLILWGTLRKDRLRRLERLGICWVAKEDREAAQEEAWGRMFASLRAFKRAHGHLLVPKNWPVEPSLAGWIATQRHLRKRGSLSRERIRWLEELEFEWNRPAPVSCARPWSRGEGDRHRRWDRLFLALEDFKREHGDCAVPSRWAGNRLLAHWVANQRALRKRGLLSPARVERLTRLGFEWTGAGRLQRLRDRQWKRMFAAYAASRSGRLSGGPEAAVGRNRLSSWITRQRNDRTSGRLREDRRRLLDGIGFEWLQVPLVATS